MRNMTDREKESKLQQEEAGETGQNMQEAMKKEVQKNAKKENDSILKKLRWRK